MVSGLSFRCRLCLLFVVFFRQFFFSGTLVLPFTSKTTIASFQLALNRASIRTLNKIPFVLTCMKRLRAVVLFSSDPTRKSKLINYANLAARAPRSSRQLLAKIRGRKRLLAVECMKWFTHSLVLHNFQYGNIQTRGICFHWTEVVKRPKRMLTYRSLFSGFTNKGVSFERNCGAASMEK